MIFLLAIISALALESGSAAVVIRTRDQVVVASDSKSVRSDDRTAASTICKISRFGDIIAVSTGLQREISLGYDITNFIKTAATSTGATLQQKMMHLDGLVVPELERVMTMVRTMDPEWFSRHYEFRKELLVQVAFVSVGEGTPDVAVRAYRPIPELIYVRVTAENVAAPVGGIVFLGEDEAMYQLTQTEGMLIMKNPTNGARSLIQAAIGQNPALVGPPVRIISVRQGNVEWVEGQSGCDWH